MAKYIIDVPDDRQYQYRYNEDAKELKFPCPRIDQNSFMGMYAGLDITISGATPYEPDRKAIEDEVWNFAKNLLNYTNKDWEDLMNLLLVGNCSYQEAKNMYEEWEREKSEIQIGDEVKIKDLEDKGIVTSVLATRCDVLWLDGTVSEDVLMSDLCKTGKHFDEVEELLKKIKEKS